MCDFPIYTKKGYVPCGGCSDCIGTKRQDWNNRLYYEAFNSTLTIFLTLTYNDENLKTIELPVMDSDVDTMDINVLYYRDVVNYWKRLRKEGLKFKYFYVGEYGEKSKRPHYHAIMFFNDNIDLLYLENLLNNKWQLGQISIFLANQAMLKYTTKDMLKELYSFHHLPKEYRPRLYASNLLGCSYIEYYKTWHRQNIIDRQKMAINGTLYGLPRYYREKIFTKDEREIIRLDNQDNRRNYYSSAEMLRPEFGREIFEKEKLKTQIIEDKLKKRLKITHFKKSL